MMDLLIAKRLLLPEQFSYVIFLNTFLCIRSVSVYSNRGTSINHSQRQTPLPRVRLVQFMQVVIFLSPSKSMLVSCSQSR